MFWKRRPPPQIAPEDQAQTSLQEMEAVRRALQRLSKRQKLAQATIWCGITLVNALIIKPFAFQRDWFASAPEAYANVCLLVSAGMLLVVVSLLFVPLRWRKECDRFLRSQLKGDSVQELGLILDIIASLPMEEQKSAIRSIRFALLRALRRLQPEDASHLSPKQKETLGRLPIARKKQGFLFDDKAAGAFDDNELCIALLLALQKVGDSQSIEPVRKIWYASSGAEIPPLAKETLNILQARSEQEAESQTLLRASDRATPQEALLRPAQHIPAETETLLRPNAAPMPTPNEPAQQQTLRVEG